VSPPSSSSPSETAADPPAGRETGGRRSRPISPALGCLLSILLGLLGVACVLIVGLFATQGEIAFRRGEPDEVRVWLVREPTNQGLGLSTGRVTSRAEDGRPVCVESRIRFLLWRSDGSARALTFCDCAAGQNDEHIEGPCPRGIP
jgi:hypothetical protein